MARYLAVAHRTATSPELVERARQITAEDPAARFTILVPTSGHDTEGLDTEGLEPEALTRHLTSEARERFEHSGLHVDEALIGDASPVKALDDELRRSPGVYRQIILCTLPLGLSRWLGMDVRRRVERKASVPVSHVVAEPAMAGAGR